MILVTQIPIPEQQWKTAHCRSRGSAQSL